MKIFPVFSENGEHDYNISVENLRPEGTYYCIYYGSNSLWTNKDKVIGGILDSGNGLKFDKALHTYKTELGYDVVTAILILLAFIKNKGNLCDNYEIREPANIVAKI